MSWMHRSTLLSSVVFDTERQARLSLHSMFVATPPLHAESLAMASHSAHPVCGAHFFESTERKLGSTLETVHLRSRQNTLLCLEPNRATGPGMLGTAAIAAVLQSHGSDLVLSASSNGRQAQTGNGETLCACQSAERALMILCLERARRISTETRRPLAVLCCSDPLS